jgi:hypothetical protein
LSKACRSFSQVPAYDYANEADHMLDEEGWGRAIFAVLDPADNLIGELSIEFFDAQGEYTDYLGVAKFNQRAIKTYT